MQLNVKVDGDEVEIVPGVSVFIDHWSGCSHTEWGDLTTQQKQDLEELHDLGRLANQNLQQAALEIIKGKKLVPKFGLYNTAA